MTSRYRQSGRASLWAFAAALAVMVGVAWFSLRGMRAEQQKATESLIAQLKEYDLNYDSSVAMISAVAEALREDYELNSQDNDNFWQARTDVYEFYHTLMGCLKQRECAWSVASEMCPSAAEVRNALDEAWMQLAEEPRPRTAALDEFNDRCLSG